MIAASCGRLPMVNKLIICDHKAGRYDEDYIKMANDDDALLSSLVDPSLWEQEEPEDWGDAGSQLLIKLPVAIHNAGATITAFHVAISAP